MIPIFKKTLCMLFAGILACGSVTAETNTDRNTAGKSKEQREMMSREFGITDQQGVIIQRLSRIRTQQIDSLNRLRLPDSELKAKREAITDEYYLQISKILTEEQLKWFDVDALKAARSEEVTSLGLSPKMTVQLGKLKSDFKKARTKVITSGMAYSTIRQTLKEIETKYHKEVKSLIGEERYRAWEDFNKSKTERIYMRKHGFTPEQIAAFSPEAFHATETEEIKTLNLSPELALMLGELLISHQEKANLADRQKLSKDEIKAYKEAISQEHHNNVRLLIGEDKYRQWADFVAEKPRRIFMKQHNLKAEQVAGYDIEVFRIIKGEEIKSLNLPPLTALAMGKLKLSHMHELKSLPENKKERKTQRQALEDKYRSDLHQLLGNRKFSAWMEYQNQRIERTYTEKYGFTKHQFEQFKKLENKQAIEILRIKNSAIPKEQKKAKIQEAKERKIKQLEQILSVDQFSKWHKDYLQKEEKRNMR